MTLIKSRANSSVNITACAIDNDSLITSINAYSYSPTETTHKFALYKGKSQMIIYVEDATGYEVNGNAELRDDEGVLFIYATGDFTLIIP